MLYRIGWACALLALFVALWVWMQPANAQQICLPTFNEDDFMSKTDTALVARGVTGGGCLMSIYAGDKGNFVVLTRRPKRMTCMSEFGEDFEQFPIKRGKGA